MKKLEQIIAENMLRFGSKNLSESDKKIINNLNEQEEDPTVTKSKSIGFKTEPRRNRMRGVQKGGAIGGATYTVTKEKDIDLVTSADMLNKMNTDLTESEDYKKLSIDIKNQLATGYYDALLTILNSDVIKKLSQSQKRDLKKFFRKSQRWAFEAYELSEEDTLKIKLQSTNELSDQQLKEAASIISISLNELNAANATAGTISDNTANSIRVYENDLEFITRQKEPLSTILVNIEKGLGQKTLKAAQTVGVIKPVTLSIPKNTKVFPVNKFAVTEAANMAKSIENQILNNMFSVTEGKQIITKSGRDIVEAGGVLKVNTMNTISSASNFYGGVTDFSHSNDGNKVKSYDSIDNSGGSGKNKKLAQQRNTSLQEAIRLQLQKVSWLDLSQTTFTNDVRITDTGGVIDENPTRNKSTHPNPGQYGQLELSLSGQIEYQKDQPGSYSRSASFRQFGIRLRYIGKRETERSLTMGLITGGKDKAQLVKARPIKTALQNLGMILTTDKDDVRLKSNPNSLKGGGDNWHNRRTNQNVRKGASGGYY